MADSIKKKYPYLASIIVAIIFLIAVSITAVIYAVLNGVVKANEAAIVSAESFGTSLIQDRLDQLSTLTKDYAFWDDIITNAYLVQDLDWIDGNIGTYLTEAFQITDLFIIAGDDNQALLSLYEGRVDDSFIGSIDQPGLNLLIKNARESGTNPVPVSGILKIQGIPALIGISILEPQDETSLPEPRPVLVLAKRLDSKHVDSIAGQYRLESLRLIDEQSNSKQKNAYIPLLDPFDNELGNLSWMPRLPGDIVLSRIKIPLIFALCVALFLAVVIIFLARSSSLKLSQLLTDLEFNSSHDPLTGLLNRRMFDYEFDQELKQVKRNNTLGALLYFDLDLFKSVNDSLGHKAGDQLLIEVARRLKGSVRESDSVARIGGDEFVVILRNIKSISDVKITLEKQLDLLHQPYNLPAKTIEISVSIGVAMIPEDGLDAELLASRADKALFASKSQGGNTFRFYSDLKS